VPVRVWFMALFAWVFEAAVVAVLMRQYWAYKRRGRTREKILLLHSVDDFSDVKTCIRDESAQIEKDCCRVV